MALRRDETGEIVFRGGEDLDGCDDISNVIDEEDYMDKVNHEVESEGDELNKSQHPYQSISPSKNMKTNFMIFNEFQVT